MMYRSQNGALLRERFKYALLKYNDRDNRFDTNSVCIKSNATTLTELLDDVLIFIKASGFSIPDGAVLDVVGPEEMGGDDNE